MSEETMIKKHTDTHLRVNTELRNFLSDTQELYNSRKHEETPHMSINALCNMAIISMKDHVNLLNCDEDRMLFLTQLAEDYGSLVAKGDYVHEYHDGGDSHE